MHSSHFTSLKWHFHIFTIQRLQAEMCSALFHSSYFTFLCVCLTFFWLFMTPNNNIACTLERLESNECDLTCALRKIINIFRQHIDMTREHVTMVQRARQLSVTRCVWKSGFSLIHCDIYFHSFPVSRVDDTSPKRSLPFFLFLFYWKSSSLLTLG